MLYGNKLNSVPYFTFLRSTVAETGELMLEIQWRMVRVSVYNGIRRQRLRKDYIHHVPISVIGKILRAVVTSSLLYGAESWAVYRGHVRKIHYCMIRSLQSILKTSRKDKMTNKELLNKTGLSSMEKLLIRKNLRWTPRQILSQSYLFINERAIRLRCIDTSAEKHG